MPSSCQLERTVGRLPYHQQRGDTAEERSTLLQFVSGRHHHQFQNVEVCFRKARIAECLRSACALS